MSATEHLDVANLAVYALFSLPAIYCLVVHGKHGLLGWAYVLAMCGLRIAGSAMSLNAIHHDEVNTTAAILNGIGLSPLLMAAMGLLHEAYVFSLCLYFTANRLIETTPSIASSLLS